MSLLLFLVITYLKILKSFIYFRLIYLYVYVQRSVAFFIQVSATRIFLLQIYSSFWSATRGKSWPKLGQSQADELQRHLASLRSRMVCRPLVKVSTCTNIPGTNSMTTDTRWPPRPAFTGSCLWSLKWQMNIAWSLTRQLGLAEICKLFFCGTMVLKCLQTFPLPFSFVKAIDFLLWSAVFPWIKTI